MQTFLGVIGGLTLAAFAIYGFCQGLRVKPRRSSSTASDAMALNTDASQHHH